MGNLLKSFLNGDDNITDKVPPMIFQSWKRCRESNINHERIEKSDLLQYREMKELLEFNDTLLFAAKPVLKHIFNFLKGGRYLMVISDHKGYILYTLGDPSFVRKAREKILLSVGSNWGESTRGTNGIGTVLIEKTPLSIPGWTHYSSPVRYLDCWAAPITRAGGEVIGVLNISGLAGAKHEHLESITVTGAKMIEQALQLMEIKDKYNTSRESLDHIGKLMLKGAVKPGGRKTNNEFGKYSQEMQGQISPDKLPGNNIDDVPGKNRKIFAVNGLAEDTDPACQHRGWYGRSAEIRAVFEMAARAAKVDSTVLIQGESGTGKELVARYIHEHSLRVGMPFVTLNCAAIPDSLVESELFGYAEGAFTGAKKGGQPGKFELADGGTIFLDEIGDMPGKVQATLLRVLQHKEIYRIGDGRCRPVDVRIIAATNQNLRQLVDQGGFRLDLFYRLKVINVFIPPLRDRIEDLWDLVPHFTSKVCAKLGMPALTISSELYQALLSYAWPGNVRQLENCLESMVALSDGSTLTADDLPDEYKTYLQSCDLGSANRLLLQTTNLERITILQALKDANGNIAAASRILGIGRTTLYRKMDKLLIPN